MAAVSSDAKTSSSQYRLVPHARTIRKAREQIKSLVDDGASRRQIKDYLFRWSAWWANTTDGWTTNTMLQWFIETCWDNNLRQVAILYLQKRTALAFTTSTPRCIFR